MAEPDPDKGPSGGLLRSLAEQKLKSFSIGTMGKRGLSKKEQEEMRKKQEEEAVGQVYKEFVSTFEDDPSAKATSKTWVKAGTFNAGSRREDSSGRGTLYKPTAKFGGLSTEREHKETKVGVKRHVRMVACHSVQHATSLEHFIQNKSGFVPSVVAAGSEFEATRKAWQKEATGEEEKQLRNVQRRAQGYAGREGGATQVGSDICFRYYRVLFLPRS